MPVRELRVGHGACSPAGRTTACALQAQRNSLPVAACLTSQGHRVEYALAFGLQLCLAGTALISSIGAPCGRPQARVLDLPLVPGVQGFNQIMHFR